MVVAACPPESRQKVRGSLNDRDKTGALRPQKTNISGVIILQPKKCTNSDWILISWYYQPKLQAILWGESLKITIHFHWFSTGSLSHYITNHAFHHSLHLKPALAAVLSAFGVNKGSVSVLCHLFVHWWSFSHIIDWYFPQLGIFYRMFTYLSCIFIIYTWNPNDLYSWRSTPQNKAFSNQNKGHWVPGIYI